jgi:hypothetical protein
LVDPNRQRPRRAVSHLRSAGRHRRLGPGRSDIPLAAAVADGKVERRAVVGCDRTPNVPTGSGLVVCQRKELGLEPAWLRLPAAVNWCKMFQSLFRQPLRRPRVPQVRWATGGPGWPKTSIVAAGASYTSSAGHRSVLTRFERA